MSRRPKLSLPRHIKLDLNYKTRFYEATENGVLYQLTFVQMNDLKIYCSVSQGSLIPTVESWYKDLTSYSKKEVKRFGAEVEHDGFWADETYVNPLDV